MTQHKPPTFFELSNDEAVALLDRNHVGRLAFTLPRSRRHRADLVRLRRRLALCANVARDQAHDRAPPSVGRVRGRRNSRAAFDWKSVVVHGTIYFLEADIGEKERANYDAAVAILRSADAGALTPGDTAPHRQALFRIHADEVIGRGARS